MFTGLVETLGVVTRLEARPQGRRIEIQASFDGPLAIGESVAVDGCCLTVVAASDGAFEVETVPETSARTTLGQVRRDQTVNLERALRVGDRLGGHLVQGHVDAVGTVRSVTGEGAGRRVRIALPPALVPFVAEKGSITVDGVSLTIAACDLESFEVALIPHTLERTIARGYHSGTRVNLEVDVIARYIARQRQTESLERGGK